MEENKEKKKYITAGKTIYVYTHVRPVNMHSNEISIQNKSTAVILDATAQALRHCEFLTALCLDYILPHL